MSPFTFILELLTKLPPALSATRRLVDATKASEPPPPEMTGEAAEFLRGRNYEIHRQFIEQQRQKRLQELRDRIDGEPEEPDP